MLEIVFDRLVRLMTTSLRNFPSEQRRSLARSQSPRLRVGDYSRIPLARGVCVFKAEEWEGGENFGPGDGGFEPDLFDDRRSPGRPAAGKPRWHRGPSLHDHRNQSRQAALVEVVMEDAEQKAFRTLHG